MNAHRERVSWSTHAESRPEDLRSRHARATSNPTSRGNPNLAQTGYGLLTHDKKLRCEGDNTMENTSTGVAQLGHIWGDDPETFQAELLLFMRALLSAAAGDGSLGSSELNWVLSYAKSSGLTDAGLDNLRNDSGQAEVSWLVSQINPAALPEELTKIARALVFDAVQASSADGVYNDREQQRVHQLIGKLGLTREDVLDIERTCLAG